MSDDRLQRLLERAGDDGRAGAEQRAWPVMHEAFVRQRATPGPRRTSRPLLAFAAIAVLALIAALAVTNPGAAVAKWVRDHIVGKRADEIFKNAQQHRQALGDDKFFAQLNQGTQPAKKETDHASRKA